MEFKSAQLLIDEIRTSSEQFDKEAAERFASYCWGLKGDRKSAWFHDKSIKQLAQDFRRVQKEGLPFDGKHVTYLSTGISYDYVAYKNKMLQAYEETLIDAQLVYQGDEFTFSKESGKVIYKHNLKDPFNQKDEDIVGGYVVIKNRRGEFVTTLSKDEFDKHRKVAKTDYIWKAWYKEMCLKTMLKKACKFHFDDLFSGIEEIDNENYDLEKAERTEIEDKSAEIRVLLDKYEGTDKEDIRAMCIEKHKAEEFTVEFANQVIEQLKA